MGGGDLLTHYSIIPPPSHPRKPQIYSKWIDMKTTAKSKILKHLNTVILKCKQKNNVSLRHCNTVHQKQFQSTSTKYSLLILIIIIMIIIEEKLTAKCLNHHPYDENRKNYTLRSCRSSISSSSICNMAVNHSLPVPNDNAKS